VLNTIAPNHGVSVLTGLQATFERSPRRAADPRRPPTSAVEEHIAG